MMRLLTAYQIVQAWEWGQVQHPVDRALYLLALACPECSPDELASLTVGQRNARLLALRAQTFGETLAGFAHCGRCGEPLEFTFPVAALSMPEPAALTYTLHVVDVALRFRLPNSHDLAALVGQPDLPAARLLLQRCTLGAEQGGRALDPQTLPDELIPALAEAITEHDPLAEIRFQLECPACQHQWSALFDIVSFFWAELTAHLKRLLADVHILASRYGWRETDILMMSAARRQVYLDMAN